MLNNKVTVITNNPEVYSIYGKSYNMKLIQGTYYDVLVEARNLVHQGYELITHPLVGSVKPNETPYRSLILKQGTKTDFQSVEMIEISIQTYERFDSIEPTPTWSQTIMQDFGVVDSKLFESSLDSIYLYA